MIRFTAYELAFPIDRVISGIAIISVGQLSTIATHMLVPCETSLLVVIAIGRFEHVQPIGSGW